MSNVEMKKSKKSSKPLDTVDNTLEELFVGTPPQEFKLERKMPHGFFVVKPTRGRLPDELTGLYTQESKALAAIENYKRKQV